MDKREELEKLSIYELRARGRNVGVKAVTTKKQNVIIDEILRIESGELEPVKNNMGRPPKNFYILNDMNGLLEEKTIAGEKYDIENIINNEFSTITLIELANRLHMGERELQRYLLKNYKKSFNELKTEAKMNFAANKLIYTDIKISELYEYVGYSTPEHFSFAFKKHFNISPLEYRNQNKKHQ